MSMSAALSDGDNAEFDGNGRAGGYGNSIGSSSARELVKEDLGDSDIELLFDIVNRANDDTHQSSDRAHNALFAAYDEFLIEGRVTVEDFRADVLHKFLEHMHRNRQKGEGLVEAFQRVLADMGVETELDPDGEGVDVTTPFRVTTRDVLEGGPGRHASFESFFDGSADKIAGTTDTGQRIPVRGGRERSGSDGGTTTANGDLEKWWNKRSRSDTGAVLAQHQSRLPVRSKTNGLGSRPAVSEQQVPVRRRSSSVASRGSLIIRRTGLPRPSKPISYNTGSESTAQSSEFDFSNVQIPGVNSPIPTEPFQKEPPLKKSLPEPSRQKESPIQKFVPEPFQLSDTRLLDDAETFEQQRMFSLARRSIQLWRQRTHEQVTKNEKMNRIAIAFDRKNLLSGALAPWRNDALVTRNDRETERFFGKLETRAERARNLFLLTKSFTHWAKSAEDEVQRTSVARRHILRTRFFNGWREITAVNELKIQHFVLAKFLKKWRKRTASVRYCLEYAENMCEYKLVHKYFRTWFFKFCETAAPAYHNRHLAESMFTKLREIAALLRDRGNLAADHHARELSRRLIHVWKQKKTEVQELEPRGQQFRRRTLLASGMDALQKQAKFAPLLTQLRTRQNARCIRSAFQHWRHSAQLSRRANKVNRMRLLHNTWTTWNDGLRIKALEERINDRVLVEAMYRWALASRVSLFQRVHNRNLKESAFLAWITRTNERRNTLDGAERRFAQFKRTQLLRTCLRKFEVDTAEKRAEQAVIKAQYEQKLKQRIVDKLVEKNEHFQQLNRWSADARYYVLSTRTLKTWSEATQHARRNRRREMYVRMRRTVKVNLVRKTLGIWREKTDALLEKNQQATDVARNRTMRNATALLTYLRDRAAALRDRDAEVEQQSDDKLKSRILNKLLDRMARLQAMNTQAIALYQENTDIIALSALKKLGWKLWTVQRQEETAIALHQRNFEKHQRAMIRFWLDQAINRRAARPPSPSPSGLLKRGGRDRDEEPRRDAGSSRRDGDGDDTQFGGPGDDEDVDVDADGGLTFNNAGEETQRLEAWTAFDENALGLSNLDLSLSLSPEHHPPHPPSQPASDIRPVPRPTPLSSSSRYLRPPVPGRPQTYPQPQTLLRSALRPWPRLQEPSSTIPEDLVFDDPSAFWTSTPMPPQSGRPGYLKTPSKRSVARSKRPELPPSPEKGALGIERGAGVMSAPPVQGRRDVDVGITGGVKSFERRLVEGGFGGSGSGKRGGREKKGRVGFGNVSFL